MNWEMKDRMMSVKADKGFEPYCCQLQEITNKLDEVQWLRRLDSEPFISASRVCKKPKKN